MSFRRADEADADYLARAEHRVELPESYEDWRTYAFSSAPELTDRNASVATPIGGIPTV